jgi:hypothetical protein
LQEKIDKTQLKGTKNNAKDVCEGFFCAAGKISVKKVSKVQFVILKT